MKVFFVLLTKEKLLIINRKMMTLTFSKLYTVIKIMAIAFPNLLIFLKKDTSVYVENYKYLKK